MLELPFVGEAYTMDSLDISAQRCVNMYPEAYKPGSNTKSPITLRPTHGLSLFAAMNGNNQIRGLYQASTGDFFAVRGNHISEFDTAGSETDRGVLSLGSGNTSATSTIVRFADNGTQMLVADGTVSAITYNLSTDVTTQITDADYPGGSFCGILDGFYIVNDPNTLFAYYSAVDDPTTWSSANTITKEGTTDYINSLIVSDRRLWLFGSQSYEIHYNTGDSSNQFLRIEGTYREIGNQAPDSLAQNGTSVFWLGGNAQGFGRVYMSEGYEARPISTVPIERDISSYTTTTDAEGFCFQQDGHEFYQLTFPSENKTWVYDMTTGMWHEKLYRNPNTSVDERHRARVQGFFNGNNYFGDWDDGNIYEVSQTTDTDNGNTIIRKRVSPTHWNALERVFYKSFQLDIEEGVGLSTGQGSNPLVMLRHSNDGGHTWSNKVQISGGKIGKYLTRVKKNRLGSSRARVWEITYSEPTKFNILNAHVKVG